MGRLGSIGRNATQDESVEGAEESVEAGDQSVVTGETRQPYYNKIQLAPLPPNLYIADLLFLWQALLYRIIHTTRRPILRKSNDLQDSESKKHLYRPATTNLVFDWFYIIR